MNKRLLLATLLIVAILLSVVSFAACKQKENPSSDTPIDSGKLPPSKIAGTYMVNGTEKWDDFENDANDYESPVSFQLQVAANGGNALSVTVTDLDYSVIYLVPDYDPATGTCVLEDEGDIEIFVTFAESDGTISVTMRYEKTEEAGRIVASYSGVKK